MADYLNIAGRIRTTASDGVAMEAQEVKDLNLNKSQQEVNADVQTELGDRYTKEETYSKEQLNELITTPDVNYVSVVATNATTAVTDILPATGEADTIYRVGNWNGTQYDPTMYALFAWNGSAYVCLAVRSFVGEVYDISVNHPDGQGNPTPYADLAAALGNSGENIPADIRRGGMRIQFIQGTVQSSDNNYVQYRLMADEFTIDVAQWQNIGDFLEEKEHLITEQNVVGYLTDKNKSIIAKLMSNGSVEWLVKNSSDILVDGKISDIEDSIQDISGNLNIQTERVDEIDENAIREVSIEDVEVGVAGYIIDKNRKILATINKDGSINRLMENERDRHTVRFEDADIEGIRSLLVSKGNRIISAITDKGEVQFYGGGGFAGEFVTERRIDEDYVKVLTSADNQIIGYIDRTGKVVIYDFYSPSIGETGDALKADAVFTALGFTASGTENHKFVSDKTYRLLDSTKVDYHKDGAGISGMVPCISITDDDTIDNQIPVSQGREDAAPQGYYADKGGYFSILYPLIKSINEKYKSTIRGKAVCGLASEGQRIGLTQLGMGDEYTALNVNGQHVNELVEKAGWEVMCHSMTARYMAENYLVNGAYDPATGDIDDTLARGILSYGIWGGTQYNWKTTTVYNQYDGRNYVIRQDKSGWDLLPQKLVKPYCKVIDDASVLSGITTSDSYGRIKNNPLIINPSYKEEYQVGEWFKRAEKLGLKCFGKVCISWGSSASVYYLRERAKYANYQTAPGTGNIPNVTPNFIPVGSCIIRVSYTPTPRGVSDPESKYNVYTEYDYAKLTAVIDKAIEQDGWLILVSHANDPRNYNGYWQDFDYPTERTDDRLNYRDNNYPEEWRVPLKYAEINSMDANNYWEVPPARLNIQSWADWYPCPGTTMALLYDVLRYAVEHGLEFISMEEGLRRYGNLLSIGYHIDKEGYYPVADEYLIDHTKDDYKAYCIIGADGSVRINGNNY